MRRASSRRTESVSYVSGRDEVCKLEEDGICVICEWT